MNENHHDHDAKLKSHATKFSSSNTKTNFTYEAKFWFSTPSFLFLTMITKLKMFSLPVYDHFVHCYRESLTVGS